MLQNTTTRVQEIEALDRVPRDLESARKQMVLGLVYLFLFYRNFEQESVDVEVEYQFHSLGHEISIYIRARDSKNGVFQKNRRSIDLKLHPNRPLLKL